MGEGFSVRVECPECRVLAEPVLCGVGDGKLHAQCSGCSAEFAFDLPELSKRQVSATRQSVHLGSADENLEDAWSRLQGTWSSGEAHEAFVATAFAQSSLPTAGRLYRQALNDPTKANAARAMLGKIQSMAMATMAIASSASRDKTAVSSPYRRVLGLVAALVLLTIAALGMAQLQTSKKRAETRPKPTDVAKDTPEATAPKPWTR